MTDALSGFGFSNQRTGFAPARTAERWTIGLLVGPGAVKVAIDGFARTGQSTVFQSAAWLKTWIDTIGLPRGCDIIAAEVRDAASRQPLFLLPLVRRKARALTLIELPDFGMADYGGPIYSPNFRPEREVMRALWRQIVAALPPADVLRIGKIPPKINNRINPLMHIRGIRRHVQSAWGTQLSAPPLDFSALGMPKKRVRELNNRFRRLQEVGPVAFRTAETAEEADRFFAAMCAQRAKRFAERGRPNALERQDIRDFFRALLKPGADDAPAVIQALIVGDEIVATGYGLRAPGAFHMIFATFEDGRWRPLSPSLQHFRLSMEWAARSGIGYYDFTLGSETYKAELGAREVPLFEIYRPLSARGRLATAVLGAKRAVRNHPGLARFLRGMAERLCLRSK